MNKDNQTSTPPEEEFSDSKLQSDLEQNISDERLRDLINEYVGQLANANEELRKEISARKKTELRLRQSEELHRITLSYISDAVFITDDAGKFTFVCPNVKEIFGYSFDEVLEMEYISGLIGNDFPFPEPLAEHQVARNIEHTVQDKNGRDHVLLVNLKRVAIQQGTLLYTMRDITGRKILEAENQQLATQFYQAQKMESIGRLAGGIAHDFNNMLSIIQMNIHLIKGFSPPVDPLFQKIHQIELVTQHAASLTKQLLAFSQNQDHLTSKFNLNELMDELIQLLESLMQQEIECVLNLEKELWPIKADPIQIEQVILNLVINAIDAMPKGGKLIINTSNIEAGALFNGFDSDFSSRPWVLLDVIDTGLGMDQETVPHIFEPFFTTKPAGEGTGLGLATVHGIVTQSGGLIHVNSESGVGTTFKIFLPPAETPTHTTTTAEYNVELAGGTETILLVEDEHSLRQIVGDTLRTYGYTVLEAATAESGLQIVRDNGIQIDLLLTDSLLPAMNGRSLYERLLPDWKDLKVLYMSGGYEDPEAGQLRPFLQKPFSVPKLLETVRQALNDRKNEP